MLIHVMCVIMVAGAVESGSQSAHKTTQYEKLAQEASDEEIEDDVVFLQEGVVLHRNGFAANNHDEIISARKTIDDAALEGLLQKGKVSSKRPVGSDFVQVKTARWRWRRILNCRRVVAILLILLFSLITTLVSILIAYHTGRYVLPTPSWKKEYNDYGKFSYVCLCCPKLKLNVRIFAVMKEYPLVMVMVTDYSLEIIALWYKYCFVLCCIASILQLLQHFSVQVQSRVFVLLMWIKMASWILYSVLHDC